MSKASKWAERARALGAEIAAIEARRGELDCEIQCEGNGKRSVVVHAFVMEDGPTMHLGAYDATLTAEQALTLARWIIATFGDGE